MGGYLYRCGCEFGQYHYSHCSALEALLHMLAILCVAEQLQQEACFALVMSHLGIIGSI